MEKFKPTQEMISLAKSALKAEAFTATIRPIVIGYETRILAEHKFHNRDANRKDWMPIILNPEYSYMLSDEDFLIYNQECKNERDKAGLKVDDDEHCPLLVAENLERIAKRALVDSMKPVTKMDSDMALNSGLKNYHKLVDLTMKLFAAYFKEYKIEL